MTGFASSSMNPELDHRDGPRDECGVFGVYAPGSEVARLAYFALYALQHRGQESAGIATSEGGHIMTVRDLGLVSQVFDEEKLRALQGEIAVGHVRYSTTGSSAWENAQPVWRSDRRQVALAHNGNLINAVELHAELSARGVQFRGTSDSEIIAALLSTHEAPRIEDALAEVVPQLEGAFSTVVMTKDTVVAFRDPAGLRPLSLGRIGDSWCVASESCAFDIIGAQLVREVAPGEMVSLGAHGIETRQLVESERRAFCVFEHIYFARPDSILEGNRTQVSRRKMGEILFREAPVDADVVIAVPDSGNPAATGYSRAPGWQAPEGRRVGQAPVGERRAVVHVHAQVLTRVADHPQAIDGRVEVDAERGALEGDVRARAQLGLPAVVVDHVHASAIAEAVEVSAVSVVPGGRPVVDAHEPGVHREAADDALGLGAAGPVGAERDQPAVGGQADDVEVAATETVAVGVTVISGAHGRYGEQRRCRHHGGQLACCSHGGFLPGVGCGFGGPASPAASPGG